MVSKLLKTIVFILILTLYASLLFYKIDFFSLSINDLGRHIKNGQTLLEARDVLTTNFYSYTHPDFPFLNHHWLSGAVFNFLHKIAGFNGLVIFKTIVLLSAFTFIFFASTKRANFWLVAFFSLPTILILKERTELRPEIFSYLFIAIFIYFLIDLEKNPGRKRVFWLIPLQVLWVNLHAFFFIGILLAAGFLFEKAILNIRDIKNNLLVKKLTLLLALLALACFVNPNGFGGVFYLFDIVGNYGFNVAENQSLSAVKDAYWWDISIKIFTPMVFLLALSFLFSFKHKPVFYFLASLGTIIASFLMVRALPLFALIFLPAISFNFNKPFFEIRTWINKNWSYASPVLGKVSALALAAAIAYTGLALHKTSATSAGAPQEKGMGLASHTNDAAAFFKENELKGPIFNDFNTGSYLIYHIFPKERVFIDNRPEAYPASFFKDVYYPMLESENKWKEIQEEYGFNVIFLGSQNLGAGEEIFLMARLSDPDWPLVYANAYSVILLKNIPENYDMIEKFQITPENIAQKINYLLKSDKLSERAAAVNLFIAMGREDLLIDALQNILELWPEYSGGWLLLGQLASMQEDPQNLSSAAAFIEKAIELGERTSEAYTILGLTYFRTGQFEKAEQALKTALKINPKRQDAKSYLIQLQEYSKKY